MYATLSRVTNQNRPPKRMDVASYIRIRRLSWRSVRICGARTGKGSFEEDSFGIQRIVVFYKGERMGEATRLDFLANDRPPSSPEGLRPTSRPPPGDETLSNQ